MIKTSKKKFTELIESLRIKNNSTVIVHSSLFLFGKIEGGPKTILNILISKFCKEGTLIIPTFTYSFRRNLIYDVDKSKCHPQIGIMPEIFRKEKNTYRNLDPLFSFAALGTKKNIITRTSNNCFGKNSVFDHLFKSNGIILSLGVEMTYGITEFLHIENMANVPYRYKKKFSGFIIDHNKVRRKDSINHFIKDESFFIKYKSNREIFKEKLIYNKICNQKKFAYGYVFTLDMKNLFDFSYKELKKNPFVMIQKI